MDYIEDKSYWGAVYGKPKRNKRKALKYPRDVPADITQVQLNYLNARTIFRLVPTEGDYALKKQKLDDWTAPSEDEVTL
jgi:hypothetical protein